MSTTSFPNDLADALATAGDPAARATIVVAFLSELYDTVGWVVASSVSAELASLERVVDEARSHQARLLDAALGVAATP